VIGFGGGGGGGGGGVVVSLGRFVVVVVSLGRFFAVDDEAAKYQTGASGEVGRCVDSLGRVVDSLGGLSQSSWMD
jgi:hypothetical protein